MLTLEVTLRSFVMQSAAQCGREIMTSKERLTVNLEHDVFSELEELAREHNVSKAWLGRQAIIRLLDQHKQKEFQFPLELNQQGGS